MSIIISNKINPVTIRQGIVPMFWRVNKAVQRLHNPIIAQILHVLHQISAFNEARMRYCHHPVLLKKPVQHVLFHA